MAQFTDEHKQEQSNFFKEGVHKVKISGIEFGTTDGGKEYAEFTVVDDNGLEDSARVWFTTDAAIKYSFNIFRQIFVHNAPEDKKDKTRLAIDALPDTEALAKSAKMLIGKECWFTVYKNLERTYVDGNSNVKPSFDKNIYGYEPEAKETSAEAKDRTDPIHHEGEEIFDF